MMSLLTPMRSEVDHVKLSLFLLRNTNSSSCSSRVILVPWQIAWSEHSGIPAAPHDLLDIAIISDGFLEFGRSFCVSGAGWLLIFLGFFSTYEMDILVVRCEAVFNVSGIF
jgi:hypothetical protein